MIDSVTLSKALTERFGLGIKANIHLTPNGQKIVLHPDEILPSKSFQIEILLGWRSVNAKYLPGNFSSSFIYSMSMASTEQKKLFSVFAESLILKGSTLELYINNQSYAPLDYTLWPREWNSISIEMKKIGVLIEKNKDYDFNAAYPWTTGFLGMVISLLPIEEVNEKFLGEKEGTLSYKTVKKYERSRLNRAACIEIHGTSCKVCGINFKDTYGEIGEGFIHVHHINPLSIIKKEYIINPKEDLVPVCPNCHSMLHRKNPILQVEDLRSILKRSS
jgi:5-methylcytosine-specific restriction enzyme A